MKPKPKLIDKEKYDSKPIHKVNGMPWPRINTLDFENKVCVPLKKEYLYRSMDYLDTKEARPIFDKQVEIIIKNKFSGIVDIGCRIGIVNDYLYEAGYLDYNYMGFDTSKQPIAFANERWEEFNNIEYRVANLLDENNIAVDFKVDCVIWSGILLYFENDHMKIFDKIQKFYQAKNAIIQEPCKNQDSNKWIKNLYLNTIETELESYKKKYNCLTDTIVNCNIFSGRRRILHLCM
jgi:SAM-dependent methyltransferase